MNIRKMADEELAEEIYRRFGGAELSTGRKLRWCELCPTGKNYYGEQAKFIHQCVKDSQNELVEALSRIEKFKGNMDCEKVYGIIKEALASVDGKNSHVA